MKLQKQIKILKELISAAEELNGEYQEGWEEDIENGIKLLEHLKSKLPNNKLPKEITLTPKTNTHMTHYNYYDGIAEARKRKLLFTSNIRDVVDGGHYMVICGDVMFTINEDEFPNIKRRTL
jgi:hypothetical protein